MAAVVAPMRPIQDQASQKLSTGGGGACKAPHLAEELWPLKATKIKCIFFREVAPGRLSVFQWSAPRPCAYMTNTD